MNQKTDYNLQLIEIIKSLSSVLDWISNNLLNHHKQVAYISALIANKLSLPPKIQNNLLIAGFLHDIGAITYAERVNNLQFEDNNAQIHADIGYKLLNKTTLFKDVSIIIKFHHYAWNYGQNQTIDELSVPLESHIIHLADRVSISINKYQEILGQVEDITRKIIHNKNKIFHPEVVDIFLQLADKEYFWLDLTSDCLNEQIEEFSKIHSHELSYSELEELFDMIRTIIDFRSPFTANHSIGVATTAEKLAHLAMLSESECFKIRLAGFIHDLGKLAIPKEIIEKNGPLTRAEFNLMKAHPYYTFRSLEHIKVLKEIIAIGAYHHERLNGSGYPFHYTADQLSISSRIMAVADVFTAIAEDRPYRKAMNKNDIIKILLNYAKENLLDKDIVNLLVNNYDLVDDARRQAQTKSQSSYIEFIERLSL